MEAQLLISLDKKPTKSEITLLSDPDTIIGALFLLKNSSILISNSLIKEDYSNGNYELAELYINDINMIKPRKKIRALGGLGLGAATGFVAGMLTARIIEGPHTPGSVLDFYPAMIVGSGVLGAGIGAITGSVIGGIKIKISINGSIDNYNRKKKKLDRFTIRPAYIMVTNIKE